MFSIEGRQGLSISGESKCKNVVWSIESCPHSAFSVLLLATLGAAQPRTSTPATTPVPNVEPVPNDRDVAENQTKLIELLRLSPTLTTVVARDPSLLSNQEYVTRNNPQLAAFLAAHPEVARNPEFYLFSHLKHDEGQPDEALERAVWPDVYRSQPVESPFGRVWSDMVPLIAFALGLTAIFVLARMFVGESPVGTHLQAAE